jgi:hypothetical protein
MGVGDYILVEVHGFFIKILCGCTLLLEQAKFHKAKVFNKFFFLCRQSFSNHSKKRGIQQASKERKR